MKKKPTKAESQHMAKVAGLGCIVCTNLGYEDSPAEIHHIREGAGMAQRNNHYKTIPLCHAHHRTGGYNVAYHAGSTAWEAHYGTEEELLAQVQEML